MFCPCSSLLQFVFRCILSLIPPGLPLFYPIFSPVSVSCSSSLPLSFPSLAVFFFFPLSFPSGFPSPLWFGFSSGFYSQRTQAFLGNGRRASRWRETCSLPRLKRLYWWRSFTVKTVADEDDEQLSRKRRRFQIQRTFPVWSLDVFCNFVIKPPDKL